MPLAIVPDFSSKESDVYKLYLYIEELRMDMEARLDYTENQLAVIKKLIDQKGGD